MDFEHTFNKDFKNININSQDFHIEILSDDNDTSESIENKEKVGTTLIIPKGFITHFDKSIKKIHILKRCKKCVLPETSPFIEFDQQGICNYCHSYKKSPVLGKLSLEKTIHPFKRPNGNSRPDSIIGFSGERDSSFMLHYIKTVLKMNPIAYSYDWGMLTDLGRRNQSRLCAKLGIEHILISANI